MTMHSSPTPPTDQRRPLACPAVSVPAADGDGEAERSTVGEITRRMLSHPHLYLVQRWNWKAAVTSAAFRGTIYFATNAAAGLEAASGAMIAEAIFRFCIAGSAATVSESFRFARPGWLANTVVVLLLPALIYAFELALHAYRGTPMLLGSLAASIAFGAVTAAFTLYAQRRGTLIVGRSRSPLLVDLARMPRLIATFVADGAVALWRLPARGMRR